MEYRRLSVPEAEGVGWIDSRNDGFLDLPGGAWTTRCSDLSEQQWANSLGIDIVPASNWHGDYLAVADYDSDGDVDFYVRRDGTAQALEQADLFANSVVGGTRQMVASYAINTTTVNQFAQHTDSGSASFCDFTGDGRIDLLRTAPKDDPSVAGSQDQQTLWINKPGVGPSTQVTFELSPGGYTFASSINAEGSACADFDHDGYVDAFFTARTSGSGDEGVWLNPGDVTQPLGSQ